jgi:predicted GNAT family acetyltransferase
MTPSLEISAERFATPGAFLRVAGPFLHEAEVENALILGVARDLAEKPPSASADAYFGCAREGDRILMCAFRSLPDKVGITRALDPAAVRVLADNVRAACPVVREVVGPKPTIEPFARALAELSGHTVRVSRELRIHVLHAVRPIPSHPAGFLRLAREPDRDLISRWMGEFLVEVKETGDAEDIARRRIPEEKIFLWEDRAPVSMAAATGKTPNGVRVNFVYTPPDRRGRGYASACVAAMSQVLLNAGNKYCCLYTDLANPTSNKIYRDIGYEAVCDVAAYALRGSEEGTKP